MESQKNYAIIVGSLIFLGAFDVVMYSDFKQLQGFLAQNSTLGNVFNQKIASSSDDQEASGLHTLIQEDLAFKQKIQANLPLLMNAVTNNNAVGVSNVLQNMRKTMNNEQYKRFIDTLDAQGYSALHRAAAQNNSEIMEILLDNGANPNVRFVWPENYQKSGQLFDLLDGCTPLHIIMQNFSQMNDENRECFGLMLEFSPNLTIKNLAGNSLLDVLVQSNNPNIIDFIKVLHLNGLDFNEQNVHGQTLLDVLAQSTVDNKVEIANALIQAGAQPVQKNNSEIASLAMLQKPHSQADTVELKPIFEK